MKKMFSVIITIVMLLTVVAGFAGCTNSTTSANSEISLVEHPTEETRDETGVVNPAIEVWVDRSTSAMAEADALEAKAEELAQEYGTDGVWGFSGGTEGIASSDGWTNLVKPIAQADHNTELFIVTDGEMDAPGNEEDLWVGAWNRAKVHFVCLEKNQDTENLKESILSHKDSFQGSLVTIEYFDGTKEILIDDFIETQCVIEIVDQDTKYELVSSSDPKPEPQTKDRKGFPWWIIPLILLGLTLLGLLLWWLLRNRHKDGDKPAGTATPAEKPVREPDYKEPKEPDRIVTDPTTPATPTTPPTTPTVTTQPTRSCGSCCHCWCPMRGPAIAIAIAACIFAVAVAAAVVIMAVALL